MNWKTHPWISEEDKKLADIDCDKFGFCLFRKKHIDGMIVRVDPAKCVMFNEETGRYKKIEPLKV